MIHLWRFGLGFFALVIALCLIAIVAGVLHDLGWWALLAVPTAALCYLAGTLVDRFVTRMPHDE